MTTYIALAPPEAGGRIRTEADADRLVLVPDQFSFWAFAFSLLWFVYHRMWLFVLGYLALTIGLEVLAIQIGGAAPTLVTLVISLAIGFEAQTLRCWFLERKGWRVIGHVVAANPEEAEARVLRLAFSGALPAHTTTSDGPAAKPKSNPIIPRVGTEQVIGLTLRPGTHR